MLYETPLSVTILHNLKCHNTTNWNRTKILKLLRIKNTQTSVNFCQLKWVNMMTYFCPLHARWFMSTSKKSMFTCDLFMSTCNIIMFTCDLFMSTCNIIMLTCNLFMSTDVTWLKNALLSVIITHFEKFQKSIFDWFVLFSMHKNFKVNYLFWKRIDLFKRFINDYRVLKLYCSYKSGLHNICIKSRSVSTFLTQT